MKHEQGINLKLMEGRTFILGREGHIYVDSGTASKHHAELSIIDGRVYLRDLGSTNGTYLLKNNVRVPFDQGFVEFEQRIVIGGKPLVIGELLAIAKNFAAVDDAETEIEVSNEAKPGASRPGNAAVRPRTR